MAIKDYVVLFKTGNSSDPAVANCFKTTTYLGNLHQYKTPAVLDANNEFIVTPAVMETDLECLTRLAERDGGEGTPGRVVFANSVPRGTLFEGALEYPEEEKGQKMPGLNWDTVAHLKTNQLRSARNGRLASLDVPFMRAIETGNTTLQAIIGQKKQTLRDLPDQITANLASNSVLTDSSDITGRRYLKIFSYTPDELSSEFLKDIKDVT